MPFSGMSEGAVKSSLTIKVDLPMPVFVNKVLLSFSHIIFFFVSCRYFYHNERRSDFYRNAVTLSQNLSFLSGAVSCEPQGISWRACVSRKNGRQAVWFFRKSREKERAEFYPHDLLVMQQSGSNLDLISSHGQCSQSSQIAVDTLWRKPDSLVWGLEWFMHEKYN